MKNLKQILCVASAVLLVASAAAFGGSSFDFSISSLTGISPGASVMLDVAIGGGGGASHSSSGVSLLGVNGLGELTGSMTHTATITGIDASTGVYAGGSAFAFPPNYSAALAAGSTTSIGTIFKLLVDVPGDATSGEVFTFDIDRNNTVFTGVFDPTGNRYGVGTITPGTITIVPEPSSLLLICGTLGMVLLRRRA